MIDIHCHIINNVDDGSRSIEESIEMAKIASNEGIKKIINTSHYHLYSDYITGESLKERVEKFNHILKEKGIDIQVLVGNEIYYSKELISKLDELDFYSLNNSKYVLLEFPPDDFPDNIEDIIHEFKIRNFVLILAHIERYHKTIKNPLLVQECIEQGALIQINSNSIEGKYGKEIQNFCKKLLLGNCIHFVASDAHSCTKRPPKLKKSYEYVSSLIGKENADKIFIQNPNKVIENEDIQILPSNIPTNSNLLQKIRNIFKKGR
ncbi:protein-tyrosine phosphatase [Alkalithermobacter thermoalcaliphilus JW-YL-7 = DSM 7308]|uniref:protein-tyrosine-phosphatase n=1 Tax=Alkalithermobacter thermoalcaliphilus JW-YL-7 = DSM 7308 TaxID=1121328 RepID=A0A150FSK4_CLOPD|nr:Protein-tyrosine-phosphatase [[Clostridium] paradoxum JW-YL-7 = DSM 7308]SHK69892.1 protein-tyrosine phosphatase [[Clostridium] paradoxum JW-YL-7 = DSM 7308]